MINYSFLSFFSFIFLPLFLIFFLIFYNKLANRFGLIDIPTKRKIHRGNVPLIGGLSIYSTLILFFLFTDIIISHVIIFLSSLIIFFVGLYDDKFNLGIAERIFFQIIASLIVVGFGIRIYDIGTYENVTIYLSGFGIVLSCVTIIAYSNAINFSDGLDGLASGYILNCLLSIILFSNYFGNTDNLQIIYFLLILIIIFLLSNHGLFLPKSFLGDNGSTSIGFLISCYLVYYTMPDNRYFHPVLTLWASPFPTFDFLTVFTRRMLKGINPFKPDRRHLHYLLMHSKLDNKIIPFLLVTISTSCSLIGFLVYIYFGPLSTLILFFYLFLIYFFISIYVSRFKNLI